MLIEPRARDALNHLIAAREIFKEIRSPKTLARLDAAISSAKGAVRNAGYRDQHSPEFKAQSIGLEVRHDLHGFYVCTTEEGEYEDDGNASVGFDGRPHYSTERAAWEAAAAVES